MCERYNRLLKAAQAAQVIPAAACGKPVEVWFQDEARIGQKGTLAYLWAHRGTRPRAVQDTRYASAYLPHPELVEGRCRLPAGWARVW